MVQTWCRGGPMLADSWEVHWNLSPPELETIPEYNRGSLETLHERDAWGMGNKPYREGKK